MSNPSLESVDCRRAFYPGNGCGNIICVNVSDGTPLWRWKVSISKSKRSQPDKET